MDLTTLLRTPEGKSLEFKRDLSSPEGVLRSIIAFANTAGGTLLIGVEDGTRQVRGVADPVAMEERLANLIDDRIEPRLIPDIEILPWRRSYVLAVQVYPSQNRPHHLRSQGPESGTYVRVGSTNRKADSALLQELRRFTRLETFDERPMPDLDSEAIDFRAASESFAPVRSLKRGDLETLRLVARHQGRLVPTIGGILLFGRTRETCFPDAWIQIGRFGGNDKTHIIDHAELRGHLVPVIEESIAFIHDHLRRGAAIGMVRRRDQWELPPPAVREAVINAVAHSDYSHSGAPIRIALFDDRLEVENPGLLPFGLTIEDLRRGVSKLRNRVIGRVFHELGLIEQWGSGIERMTAACRAAGLPDPQLEEIGFRFRVTLGKRPTRDKIVDDTERSILELLSDGSGRSTAEIASHIKRTPRTTRTRLANMVDRGLLYEVGTGPQDPKRRYYLSQDG